MPKLTSNWKLTFDPSGTPRVLLNYGQKCAGELRFPLSRGLAVTPIAEALDFLRPLGSQTVRISFEVYEDKDTDALARRAVMESLILVGALVKKPLRVEIDGITDRYWQFASSYITEHDPSRYLEAPVARLVKGYSITCAGAPVQVGP